MSRFLATAVIVGALTVPGAVTLAHSATGQPENKGALVFQDSARKARREGEGRAGREPHPELRRARRALETAKKALQSADKDFGGHRVEAIKSIDEALEHIRQAENYDKK